MAVWEPVGKTVIALWTRAGDDGVVLVLGIGEALNTKLGIRRLSRNPHFRKATEHEKDDPYE
jgi:hypothetical protein